MISKSVGAVFIDCDKCNPNCELQQRVKKSPDVVMWKPFDEIKKHTIRTRNLLVGIEKITQNAQKFYDLACQICHNCKERQK